MNKYMQVTYDNKNYRKELNEELDLALVNQLKNYYKFDNNNFLIRDGKSEAETVLINKKIANALISIIKNYELDDKIKNTIQGYIDELDLNSSDVHLTRRRVDDLVYLYTFVSKNLKKIKGDNNKVTQTFSMSTTSPSLATNNDLSKQILSSRDNNINENIELARQVLLRASKEDRFSKYIDASNINLVMSNIIICNDVNDFKRQFKLNDDGNSNFQTDAEFDMAMETMKAFQNPENGKIILKADCDLGTIIHEIVHSISVKNKETGIIQIGKDLIGKSNNFKDINESQIGVLNEAMTHYITRELLPELQISSAYNYGADFLKQYVTATNGYEIKNNNILDAYFNKNENSLDYIAQDINKSDILTWSNIMESCEISQYVNSMMLPIRYLKKCNTKDELEQLMKEISNKYNLLLSSSGKLDEFQKARDEYAKEEQERIIRIRQIKNENKDLNENYVRR